MTEAQPETPRLQSVKDKVRQTYLESTRKVAHWMWDNHVQFVAQKTAELADRFGANKEESVTGALLHDLGDIWVSRKDPSHDQISETESRRILQEVGFSEAEIKEIISQIIAPHSCHPGNVPQTLEGKILATADALGHLATNFYEQVEKLGSQFWDMDFGPEGYPDWARKKLDRDFHSKIFFGEIQEEIRPRYEQLKAQYS